MYSTPFEEFVVLWVLIDPIGSIAIFAAATANYSAAQRRVIALQGTFVAAGLLMFFLIVGQFLIDALGISLDAFQISGGIILFLFAIKMIFSTPNATPADPGAGENPAVYPIGVPGLAGPGSLLGIVLLTDNNRFSVPEQVVTASLTMLVLAVAFVFMLAATPILKVIGQNGAAIISRVMGLVLASVAVDNVILAMRHVMAQGLPILN
ncbi:MarC family protein [Chachezhania sediminis]|uniref:MarC family protein n=1 Tax=Chachezhania sediminis TaxID=2599291 RepID=UPI00131E9CF5|nr:MarC family protein [Chachezhania sediminis]